MFLSWLSSIFRGREDATPINKLNIPPQSRKFLCALPVPDDPSRTVYILTVESLSERSIRDIEDVSRALNPSAIFTVLSSDHHLEYLQEERIANDSDSGARLPDSYSGFVRQAMLLSLPYTPDAFAGFQVANAILGASTYAHVSAARQAASDCSSVFGLLLVPPSIEDKELIQACEKLLEGSCPQFSSSLYLSLLALDDVNKSIPELRSTDAGAALGAAKSLLWDVSDGNEARKEALSLVRRFRVTLEYERLVNNGRAQRVVSGNAPAESYSNLTYRDRSDALVAKALQRQARKFDVVLATMDWSRLAGVRRNWKVSVPAELMDYLSPTFDEPEEPAEHSSSDEEQELAGELSAFALGAAALAGASRFAGAKAAEVSRQKLQSFLSRAAMLKPVQGGGVYGPALVGYAKRRSLGAVYWSFYSLMREVQGMRASRRPWLLFGGSLVTTAGLFYAGNRLERLVEAVPAAPRLVRLGRGVSKLQVAAAELDKTETRHDWEEIYGLVHRAHEASRNY